MPLTGSAFRRGSKRNSTIPNSAIGASLRFDFCSYYVCKLLREYFIAVFLVDISLNTIAQLYINIGTVRQALLFKLASSLHTTLLTTLHHWLYNYQCLPTILDRLLPLKFKTVIYQKGLPCMGRIFFLVNVTVPFWILTVSFWPQ